MFTPILSSVFKRACLTFFSLLLFSSVSFSQWIIQNSGSNANLHALSFIDPSTSEIVGRGITPVLHGEFLRTSNAGTNWQIVQNDTGFRPVDIQFVNSLTGYSIGGFIFTSLFICYKTTDGGFSWDTVYFGSLGYETAKISLCFMNSQTGYSCGYGKIITKTTNGGSNWNVVYSQISFPLYQRLNSIKMLDAQNGWCVGDTGLVLKTINEGVNWIPINSQTQTNLLCVTFTGLNTGYIVGDAGFISKTTNSGINWNSQNSGTLQNLKSITFVNPNTGFIAGGNGLILRTTNAGLNWVSQPTGVTDTLRSIKFISTDTGYAVGDNGRILKTVNGGVSGVTPITNNVPKNYSLKQNYPNPFNPSTKIEFAVPKLSNVKIVVYDMLGRELAVIVNEELKSGEYSVSWDASQFSSGIYFYKLITGNFVDAKKMSLIK